MWKVSIRAAVGLVRMVDMLRYDGPVNGKPHARLCRYALPRLRLDYAMRTDSRSVMARVLCALALDPLTAERLVVEATHRAPPPDAVRWCCAAWWRRRESARRERARVLDELLRKGVRAAELARVRLSAGQMLGRGMGHVDATLLASLGEAPPELTCLGARPAEGDDPREVVPWAADWAARDGAPQLPLDSNSRARAAQWRLRELRWVFQCPHARDGLRSGACAYDGPSPAAPPALSRDRAGGGAAAAAVGIVSGKISPTAAALGAAWPWDPPPAPAPAPAPAPPHARRPAGDASAPAAAAPNPVAAAAGLPRVPFAVAWYDGGEWDPRWGVDNLLSTEPGAPPHCSAYGSGVGPASSSGVAAGRQRSAVR